MKKTIVALVSLLAVMPCEARIITVDDDGVVNFVDVGHYVEYWLDAGSESAGDLDRNGMVDMADYALLGRDYLLETSWH